MTNESSSERSAPASLMERIGSFLFTWRNVVFTTALIVLLGALPPVHLFGDPRADRWLDALGIAIALAGQGLRAAVIGYAYVRRGGKNRKVYADHLVTEGFFNHARNPLYLGNLLVLTGLFIIHNHPGVYLLGLPAFIFAYSAIVAAEEAYLSRHFGDEYAAYCRRVRRWLPDLRGLRRSIEGMQFDWERVVVKEYSSTFSWITAALALLAYEAIVGPPFPEREGYLALLAGIFALALLLWGWARYFKKTDKIRRRRQEARTRFE
jgi:protein-S-isoprenylcysteine O-methyltransferase Ste14